MNNHDEINKIVGDYKYGFRTDTPKFYQQEKVYH